MVQNFSLDPASCENEPIQFIESIQPFGSLLALDMSGKICHAAINDEIGWTAADLIGKNIENVLQDSQRVFDAIKDRSEPTSPMLIRESKSRRWITCIAHKKDDRVIVEIETLPSEQIDIASLKFMSDRRESLESYLSYIAENIRGVTGYDRVMIYKFGLDWHGEVVAESLNSAGYSFYGHHFPASDIPAIARNLFTQMWVRMIPDVDSANIPLVSDQSEKLDLSRSVLRAPSPIHLQYLRNMGVAASMTMSLICDGKLWGLVACHHFSPKYLIAEQRAVCALLAKVVSSRITTLSVAATINATDDLAAVSTQLCKQFVNGDFVECVRDNKYALLRFLRCDGFSFVAEDGCIVTEGHAMSADELGVLVENLNETKMEVFATDSIVKSFPVLASSNMIAAGILAIKVLNNWFIWNRHELVRSLVWAGNPNKPAYANNRSESLSPRTSFESWKENVRGTSAAWEHFEVTAVDRFRRNIAETVEHRRVPVRADAHEYLRLIRSAIDSQAAELQNQFKNLNLEGIEVE
ncbi:MAG: GAF domain-containing protein [Cyanobacteria bacterium SZAS LIN-5]|nr:GAF domain-containing protein [Cyanobacteria bacterium SZAS LIN-5]